eukprot:CAMPEP_0175054522 /NCGR_PEP_ID=MMETSP0052_2-20121109/9552_1 /TAXON_ID=51329 ORGANISM="Polytomella parva, Strain SAG 63-3" /NCGR_SAMPLE_ID=MMETSP0052_2 /ASSEMBLY_ACC=CAM_ASM_000194 /LENGTH=460 /DNA_ID=CAMNT_0016319227 /DNA_START=358 /DNA_END=1740 /DNA_ORIENTATION=+
MTQKGTTDISDKDDITKNKDSNDEPDLERHYVHDVYNAIAPHFSATRFAIWPKVRDFIDSIPVCGVVADIGCGNGKYFGIRPDLVVLGCDRSIGLAELASKRLTPSFSSPSSSPSPSKPSPSSITSSIKSTISQSSPPPLNPFGACDVFLADGLALPFRDESLDAALSIAVLHHLSTRQRRIDFLKEMARVLRPKGRAVVTVWATKQEEPAKTVNKWHRIERAPETEEREGGEEGGEEEVTVRAGEVVVRGGEVVVRGGEVVVRGGEVVVKRGEVVVKGGEVVVKGEIVVKGGEVVVKGKKEEEEGTNERISRERKKKAEKIMEEGEDFFVPWNVPLHRAEAAGIAKKGAREGRKGEGSRRRGEKGGEEEKEGAKEEKEGAKEENSRGTGKGGGKMEEVAKAIVPPTPQVDLKKGTVVLNRYYHLFGSWELPLLLREIPDVELLSHVYDKSNWVTTFMKI